VVRLSNGEIAGIAVNRQRSEPGSLRW
jgi:hypothetical protein